MTPLMATLAEGLVRLPATSVASEPRLLNCSIILPDTKVRVLIYRVT